MRGMSELQFMRLALRLAWRGYGTTSPNPMVGAVLVKGGKIIGRGWHQRAGGPHAEIAALRAAQRRGKSPRGATLYVTLEPCSTHGRTPACTDAIVSAGIRRVVVGTTDPNPRHAGKAFPILQRAGIAVASMGDASRSGSRGRPSRQHMADECTELNEAFNHWIVHRTPFITVKAAMTLDGKIATAGGESKWITGEKARRYGMRLRQGADAVLVGVNTVLADDPSLTVRTGSKARGPQRTRPLRRIVLDSQARTPLDAKVVCDEFAGLTTVVVGKHAPKKRVAALARRVKVLVAPVQTAGRASLPAGGSNQINLKWLLKKLGAEHVTRLLVEGGGEVNASFLLGGWAQRVAFFYAPKILGGRAARKAVAGEGARNLPELVQLHDLHWKQLGADLLLTAKVSGRL
jgi:diaminohydroxyphosphoribosylaminopyrimidine deaminase/5-amino-6-(5-phosphoribosylamino)uracil reductase